MNATIKKIATNRYEIYWPDNGATMSGSLVDGVHHGDDNKQRAVTIVGTSVTSEVACLVSLIAEQVR